MITRDLIKEIKDVKIEEVEVPEWGDSIFVRSLTGAEREKFEKLLDKGYTHIDNIRAKFVILCACDESGNKLFEDSDEEWLSNKTATALNRIFIAGQKLSGLLKSDFEEAVKNSETLQKEDSISELVEN